MMGLKEKVAIVTGGGTGLGAATVRALAARGALVAVNYSRSRAEAEEAARQCRDVGGNGIAIQGDVGVDSDCRHVVAKTLTLWGRIDVLVNCAGQTRKVPHADLDGLDVDDFLEVYRTNVVGAFQMIRACVPAMKHAGQGAIVNISSPSAEIGAGTSIAYASSKAALNSMTRSLARSLAPQIRVNAVAPGFMATRWFSNDLSADAMAELVAGQRALTLLDREGDPDDVAHAIAFLAGPEASHITGIVLPVEGGALLNLSPQIVR